jgi:hypothetical protein
MQLVPITTKVVSSNTAQAVRRDVLDITLCDNVCHWLIFSSADFGFLKLFFAGSYTGNLHHHVQKIVDFICI